MEASKQGYDKAVEILLFHRNVQVNKATWNDGNTALIYASENGTLTLVEFLLRCPEVNELHQNNKFESADQIARRENFYQIIEAFNNRGYLINTGHTCCSGQIKRGMQLAAKNNDSARIAYFLQCNGIQLNKGYESGRTPLYIASREGFFEIVQQLLAVTDIEVNQISNGENALIAASERGHTEVVSLLLDFPTIDTNINKRGSEGSALFLASTNGHSMIVEKLLIQPQTEVNGAYGHERNTSLIAASGKGLLDVVKLLLRCPMTNMSLQNLLMATALDVSDDDAKEVIIMRNELLKGNHTCCVNATEVLLSIAKVGDYKGIKGLAKCPNTDINKQDLKGRTALYLAAWMGHLDAVNEFLVLKQIEVNKGHILSGETAYSIASKMSHFNVMRTLSEHKNVDVNVGWNEDAWTANIDVKRQNEIEKLLYGSEVLICKVQMLLPCFLIQFLC